MGSLSTIRVGNYLFLNSSYPAAGQQRGAGIIGYPDPLRGNQWYLPTNVSLYIGSAASRGRFHIQRDESQYGSVSLSRLAVSGGGTFEAWLHDLIVGYTAGKDEGPPTAVLDLRGMDSFFMDVTSVSIGQDAGTKGPKADVFLPRGTAVMGSLFMGRAALATSYARLNLNDTQCTITNSMTLGQTAQVTINVAGSRSSGLDLPGLPVVSNGATVVVNFQSPPSHGGIHYGMKIKGDVATSLQGAGWLSWSNTLPSSPAASIFAYRGYTYVGVPPGAGTIILIK